MLFNKINYVDNYILCILKNKVIYICKIYLYFVILCLLIYLYLLLLLFFREMMEVCLVWELILEENFLDMLVFKFVYDLYFY